MPHIALTSTEPGIRGLLGYRPQTARPLGELTEVLLRGPGTLTRGERELIAAYVTTCITRIEWGCPVGRGAVHMQRCYPQYNWRKELVESMNAPQSSCLAGACADPDLLRHHPVPVSVLAFIRG